MHAVEAIVFEPVGCLAEFPAEPFIEIGARFFRGKRNASKSGSRSYWHLLNLMQMSGRILDAAEREVLSKGSKPRPLPARLFSRMLFQRFRS